MSAKRKTENWVARDGVCGREGTIVTVDVETGIIVTPQICPDCHQLATWDRLRPEGMSADMVPPKTTENKPETGTGKRKSPIAKLIGG